MTVFALLFLFNLGGGGVISEVRCNFHNSFGLICISDANSTLKHTWINVGEHLSWLCIECS